MGLQTVKNSLGEESVLKDDNLEVVTSVQKHRDSIDEEFEFTVIIDDGDGTEFYNNNLTDKEDIDGAVNYLQDLKTKIEFVLGIIKPPKKKK